MGSLPETLDRATNIDIRRRDVELWVRRVTVLLLAGVLAAALADVFGQRPADETATGRGATLVVEAPTAVRSGLMYQALFRIEANRAIAVPALVLEDGWFHAMTVNSLEPAPVTETERNGYTVFTFNRLEAGDSLTVRMSLQANPTSVGRRAQEVRVNDGGQTLARLDRSMTIFP